MIMLGNKNTTIVIGNFDYKWITLYIKITTRLIIALFNQKQVVYKQSDAVGATKALQCLVTPDFTVNFSDKIKRTCKQHILICLQVL